MSPLAVADGDCGWVPASQRFEGVRKSASLVIPSEARNLALSLSMNGAMLRCASHDGFDLAPMG
jgi:hypothetical protein